jgi:hypothetical protein
MFFVTLFILFSNGRNFESSGLILYSYYLISALGGVTLVYWISLEERQLEKYSTKAKILEDRLETLEEKIKIILHRSKLQN